MSAISCRRCMGTPFAPSYRIPPREKIAAKAERKMAA